MSDFISRQQDVLRRIIREYNTGARSLNSLIINIETVANSIGNLRFSEEISPLILSMEQINAAMIEENRTLTDLEHGSVTEQLLRLEELTMKINQSAKT
ncbi:hypothetical protein [Fundidesulfovibrio soli]|uniref:hypothetical protein n=1 Tax=Fundidesulfovibrio soli TaxID=2922716 RepID=UPI001FAFEC22|nr:hypothetical protein [Fundidesulfovibrio soli]